MLTKGNVPPSPGWTSVDGEEPWMGSALVAFSPEWMPIFCDPIVYSINIIGNRFIPSITLSTGDASENMFQKPGSTSGSMQSIPQPLGENGNALTAAPISLSSSGPQEPLACHQSLYWRLQSRLPHPQTLPDQVQLSRTSVLVLHTQLHCVQCL